MKSLVSVNAAEDSGISRECVSIWRITRNSFRSKDSYFIDENATAKDPYTANAA